MDTVSIFVIIRIGLLFILIATGYILTKEIKVSSRRYWVLSFFSILSYALIEGLRYNRGTDYMHFKRLYEYSLHLSRYWDANGIEPFFQLINKTFRIIDTPYPIVFVFYSFLLIFACFFLIKKHRRVAFFAIPLFFMVTIGQSENLVRQFVAFSFVLISINYFLKDLWIKFFLWFLLAFFTHSSSIIFLPFFFLFKYIKNPFGSVYIILGLYIASWFWKTEYWGNYYQYFQIIQMQNYQGYIDNADFWFSGDQLMLGKISILYFIRLFIFNGIVIIMGYRIRGRYKRNNFSFFYYLFVIGAITQHFTYEIEILYRISLFFYMFLFLVLAYIAFDSLYTKNIKTIYKILCILLLLNAIYDYGISPLINVNLKNTLFIWNVH